MKHKMLEMIFTIRALRITLFLFLSMLALCMPGCTSDGSSHGDTAVYGTIKSSGSTTMSNLMSIWCKGFSDIYHSTNCIIESFGSKKAPRNLLEGNVDIGAMSEPMSAMEKQDFKNKYGYEPFGIKVALDMISVLVNSENPLDCVTLSELDGIYSNTNLCQGALDITTWGGLNLNGEWSDTAIKIYGRTPSSGTYSVFRNKALCGGNFKNTITELASSKDIVEFVSKDTASIGYSGAGLLLPGVKALKVGSTKDSCYSPQSKYAVSGEYPFTRELYLYFREDPSKGMKKVTKDFLNYILSQNGQKAVSEAGLINLPSTVINQEKQKISN